MRFPAKVNVHCKKCRKPWLWVVAFDNEDGTATPVLMCDSHTGCGTVFELTEYKRIWF